MMTAGKYWFVFATALLLAVPVAGAWAADGNATDRAAFVAGVCERLEAEANAHDLPTAFFARLIWTESRFDPNAVSPKGAEGIAQFMPGTARLRGLDDPFDPGEALPESARFLADLRDEFGNLGLAAAAYNAGPARVRRWRTGAGGLPDETEDYVLTITGLTAADWTAAAPRPPAFTLDPKASFQDACRALPTRQSRLVRLAKWQPWGVQVTASFSRAKALAAYSRLQKKHGSVLAGRRPMIVRKSNLSMGKRQRYNVRLGADSRAEAQKLCARLRAAAGACIVVRN